MIHRHQHHLESSTQTLFPPALPNQPSRHLHLELSQENQLRATLPPARQTSQPSQLSPRPLIAQPETLGTAASHAGTRNTTTILIIDKEAPPLPSIHLSTYSSIQLENRLCPASIFHGLHLPSRWNPHPHPQTLPDPHPRTKSLFRVSPSQSLLLITLTFLASRMQLSR
ncbi:hypothetical protein G7046_g9509 [Stylonectria norvegica]|nr:hypothetical protein G7046_g9509 [Stylonectria norvegica]